MLVSTSGAVEKHVSNIFSKLDLPAIEDDHRRVLASSPSCVPKARRRRDFREPL
jgi:hypothetical protein